MLAQLHFVRRLTLDGFGRRRQRPRGLRCRRPRHVDPGENGAPLGHDVGSRDGEALHFLGSRQRGLTLAVECVFRVPDPGLDLQHRIRGLPAAVGDGRDDLTGRGDRPQLPMLLHDAGRFRPVRHEHDPVEQVGNEPPHVIGCLHQVGDGQQPIRHRRRRSVPGRIEQRLARILSS